MTRNALAQLPSAHRSRRDKKILVRIDGACHSHKYLTWLHNKGGSYSIGFGLTDAMVTALATVPECGWSVAVDAAEKVHDGALVIDATGVLDLTTWPPGIRVVIRTERPHPGAQLRFTDSDGVRLNAIATNTAVGQVLGLELRHRRRARCEDRIRGAQDCGLTNFPLHGFDQNRIWLAIVQLALDLTASTQMLGFTAHGAKQWEPKRIRLRAFSAAGCSMTRARRTHLRLSTDPTWSTLVVTALTPLAALPASA